MMASMTLPMLDRQIRNPPALTDSDLKPARHSEHAFFERLGSWLAWVLFGLCAIVAWLSRHRRKPMILILSDRLQGLVRPSDRAWMIAGGILVPLVWYFIVTRLTPLSAREWSARMTLFIQPGGQFGCMVLSMIILTVQLAGWRLAKRGASLGLVPRHSWMGWAAAGSALLGVPVFGGLMLPEIGWLFVNVAQVLAGVAMVWLFAWFSFEILGKASRNLRRAILARAVSPVWILGMLVMAVLTPYFHFEEKKWILQDQVGEITADAPAASRYEYGVSQILKDELLQTIGR